MAPETTIILETQYAYQRRKEADPMPSPLGEGQTDTPINRHNQGEVPFILFITPPFRLLIPHSPIQNTRKTNGLFGSGKQ